MFASALTSALLPHLLHRPSDRAAAAVAAAAQLSVDAGNGWCSFLTLDAMCQPTCRCCRGCVRGTLDSTTATYWSGLPYRPAALSICMAPRSQSGRQGSHNRQTCRSLIGWQAKGRPALTPRRRAWPGVNSTSSPAQHQAMRQPGLPAVWQGALRNLPRGRRYRVKTWTRSCRCVWAPDVGQRMASVLSGCCRCRSSVHSGFSVGKLQLQP